MAKTAQKKQEQAYTDPTLRERLKKEMIAGDKGGKPGQWSARKAQLLAKAYEDAGGGYTTPERSEAQEHLEDWTEEEWRTSDGKPAERESGTTRYLPKEAWDELTPAQQRATNEKKRRGSKEAKQFVPNTEAAKEARKRATDDHDA